MPAKTFFAMVDHGLKVESFRTNSFLADLVSVSLCANTDKEGIQSVSSYFRERADLCLVGTKVDVVKRTTVEHQDMIAKSIYELVALKMKVEGHGGR